MMPELSTLCYIEKDNKYLMLHRIKKKNDVNKDKWIGVGGHFEAQESPEECLLREVWEETGYRLTSYQYRGIVTFVYGEDVTEYMSLYTADGFEGEPHVCDEGVLEWVDKSEVLKLNLWEGDKIFFRLLNEEKNFFSLKLVYNTDDVLEYAALNGKEMELFDILDEDGNKTGIVRERGVAHRDGSIHGTVHIWVVRPNDKSGYDVLLQKRSADKDSHPGCFDISSAGHVPAGEEYWAAAVREIGEELGITVKESHLHHSGVHRGAFEAEFYGIPFVDREISQVFVYDAPIAAEEFQLQDSELEDVVWMDFEDARKAIVENAIKHCIYMTEFELLGKSIGIITE